MLTLEVLEGLPAGEIFAKGVTTNDAEGIFMVNSNPSKRLLWIAKKGHGHSDWCIYIHWECNGLEFVKESGDKVGSEANIRKLVPCTNEVFGFYRR